MGYLCLRRSAATCESVVVSASGPAAVVSISVVISTLDRPRSLARCLDALLAGTRLPTEIVVVDQGDASVTAAVLDARRGAGVELVHVRQVRRGLAVSQNGGVERARCPAVSIVDDDCVPDPCWVAVAAAQHATAEGPLLLGGRVLALPPMADRIHPLALRSSTTRTVLTADSLPWEVGTGGNFSVARRAYLEVGGNDERLGAGTPGRAGNDLDLFRRLQEAGVEARFEPNLLVLHERATPAEYRDRCWGYGFGVGACVGLRLRSGDRWAFRLLAGWLRMRARFVRAALRRPASARDEARVLLGTAQGLGYGLRLRPRAPSAAAPWVAS